MRSWHSTVERVEPVSQAAASESVIWSWHTPDTIDPLGDSRHRHNRSQQCSRAAWRAWGCSMDHAWLETRDQRCL